METKAFPLPQEIQGAVSGFLILLLKGLLDDKRWDWDLNKLSVAEWKAYQESILDPTHFKTTLAVFMNNLRVSEDNKVINYAEARFRAFQYFRASLDVGGYTWESVTPKLQEWELEESDWGKWET